VRQRQEEREQGEGDKVMEAGVKRSEQVKVWAQNFLKLFKITKWQNSVEHLFHRGILAKPTDSMAF
jgi:hypothetical protein